MCQGLPFVFLFFIKTARKKGADGKIAQSKKLF